MKNLIKLKDTDQSQFNEYLNKFNDQKILYNHFSSNHKLSHDLSFQVFISNIHSYRERLESDLIYIFNTCHPNGLNSKISERQSSLETYKLCN